MCSIKEIAIYASACLFCSQGYCQTIVPSSPVALTGGDEIRSRDGTSCKQGSHQRPTVDFGVATTTNMGNSVMASPSSDDQYSLITQNSMNRGNYSTLYARVVIPIGKDVMRLDCSRLYDLEIQRLTMEIEKMKNTGSAAIEIK